MEIFACSGDEIVRPLSRNTARRGRFPSRINTTFGPKFKNLDILENGSENKKTSRISSNMTESQVQLVTELQNTCIESSQDPPVRKIKTVKSMPVQGRGKLVKTFSPRTCQKSGRIEKSVVLSRNHIHERTQNKQLNFEDQLHIFFAESSKAGEGAPFLFEDVIPATPERPSQRLSNTVKRKTAYVNIIKKAADNTNQNDLMSREISNKACSDGDLRPPLKDLQVVLDKADSSQPLKQTMVRKSSNVSKKALHNVTSAPTEVAANKAKNSQEVSESTSPNKFKSVIQRIKQIYKKNNKSDESADGVRKEDPGGNTKSINSVEQSQNIDLKSVSEVEPSISKAALTSLECNKMCRDDSNDVSSVVDLENASEHCDPVKPVVGELKRTIHNNKANKRGASKKETLKQNLDDVGMLEEEDQIARNLKLVNLENASEYCEAVKPVVGELKRTIHNNKANKRGASKKETLKQNLDDVGMLEEEYQIARNLKLFDLENPSEHCDPVKSVVGELKRTIHNNKANKRGASKKETSKQNLDDVGMLEEEYQIARNLKLVDLENPSEHCDPVKPVVGELKRIIHNNKANKRGASKKETSKQNFDDVGMLEEGDQIARNFKNAVIVANQVDVDISQHKDTGVSKDIGDQNNKTTTINNDANIEMDVNSEELFRKPNIRKNKSKVIISKKNANDVERSQHQHKNTTSRELVEKTGQVWPAKRQQSKTVNVGVASDNDSEIAPPKKRKLPLRKAKVTKVNYNEDEIIKVDSGSTVCTRSQSALSVEYNVDENNPDRPCLKKSFIDEFFEKNNTNNDKKQEKNPKTIRRMNATSSDETDEEDDVTVKKPIHVVPRNSTTSLHSLTLGATDSQKQLLKEIMVRNTPRLLTPEKQLSASVCRSPNVEKSHQQDEEDGYVEIDVCIPRKKKRSGSTPTRKRRLFSDKFNEFSDSENANSKEKSKIDNTKRLSTESAQVYVNIQEERKRAIVSTGKNRVDTKKKRKDENIKEQVKVIEVPKTLEHSRNANFSYRRCAEEKKLSEIFNYLQKDESKNKGPNQKHAYSDFEDSSDMEFASKNKNKRSKSLTTKQAAKKKKKNEEPPALKISETFLSAGHILIDEKIRSIPVTRLSDDESNLNNISLNNNIDHETAPVTTLKAKMISPEPLEDNLENDIIETNVGDPMETDLGQAVLNIQSNVIICETDNSKHDSSQHSSGKTATRSSSKSRKSNLKKKPKANVIITETQLCEMDASLPSLIVETNEGEVKNDSLSGIDIDKMKAACFGDAGFDNISSMDLTKDITGEVALGNNDIVIESSHFQHGENLKDIEEISVDVNTKNLQDGNIFHARNENQFEKEQEAFVNCPLMDLDDIYSPPRLNNENKYNSPKTEAIVLLRCVNDTKKCENHMGDHPSDDSDSEDSVYSIILHSHPNRRLQSSNNVIISDISNVPDYDSCNSNTSNADKYRIPLPKSVTGSDNTFSRNLERISEESIPKSSHSTPKSVGSINCSKYLDKHISPVTLQYESQLGTGRKSKTMEGGDNLVLTSRRTPRKTGNVTQAKRLPNTSSKIGSRLSKGPNASPFATASSAVSMDASTSMKSVKKPLQKQKVARTNPFYIPQSENEKKMRDMGCCMRSTLDVWQTQLSTMEQNISRFRKEINSFKGELPSDCCIRHRRKM